MHKKAKSPSFVKSHTALVANWMKDPDFKAEYNTLAEGYELLREMLIAQKRAGLTQKYWIKN